MDDLSPFLFFIVIGVSLIAAELLIFNLSIFWLLFVGFGAVIAAIFTWLIPDFGWLYAMVTFIVATGLISALLYTPLKRWQLKPSAMPGNDALGQSVEVIEDIDAGKQGKVMWSGAVWDAKLDHESEPVLKGDNAVIKTVSGIVLLIQKP